MSALIALQSCQCRTDFPLLAFDAASQTELSQGAAQILAWFADLEINIAGQMIVEETQP